MTEAEWLAWKERTVRRRTAWAAALSAVLVLLAIGSIVWITSTDNERVTPVVVRDFTRGVVEVTACLAAVIWGVWYWAGRRSGGGRR